MYNNNNNNQTGLRMPALESNSAVGCLRADKRGGEVACEGEGISGDLRWEGGSDGGVCMGGGGGVDWRTGVGEY